MVQRRTQRLPTIWAEREELRKKGQFWTPSWLAETMAEWVTKNMPETVFDPAVGPGTFFAAARTTGFKGSFAGFELHAESFVQRDHSMLTAEDFRDVVEGDFVMSPVKARFSAIISNPPYIRHHRLSALEKQELRALAIDWLGFSLDGRVGLHLYFLLKSLEMLTPEGQLAFLLPADVCEGVSSGRVWASVCERFRLEAVLTFSREAAPFPQVDTNAMVFLISNRSPHKSFCWMKVEKRDPKLILAALQGTGELKDSCVERDLSEGLKTGLSRPPMPKFDGVPLSSLAKIVRGIATGANEFFFLTSKRVAEIGLDKEYFIRAVGRTRDCSKSILTMDEIEDLEGKDRATWLLNLGDESLDRLPISLQNYLAEGEKQEFHKRSLISTRRPWYKMERRAPPALLFAYLGRRDCRFVLNEAGVVPLTGFLCVYPFDGSPAAVRKLWRALNHPSTIANLGFAAKSYGSGALKAEPRQLDQLMIPLSVLEEFGLRVRKKPEEGMDSKAARPRKRIGSVAQIQLPLENLAAV